MYSSWLLRILEKKKKFLLFGLIMFSWELVYNLCFMLTEKVYLLFPFRLFSWELLSVQVLLISVHIMKISWTLRSHSH